MPAKVAVNTEQIVIDETDSAIVHLVSLSALC